MAEPIPPTPDQIRHAADVKRKSAKTRALRLFDTKEAESNGEVEALIDDIITAAMLENTLIIGRAIDRIKRRIPLPPST